ncbi:transcriptional antiterminator [Chromatiales bacterium (ex Bugula neritina AB1)]|nr:transcriptional antiterminator [Chromatiales bacterium (ex Bugula neritina AB1)]
MLESMTGAGVHDLALPATFGLPDLVSARAIIPLTEYAKKHEPLGFREAVLYNIGDSFDDQIYGFQADGDAYLMFYNREYLENVDEQKRYEDKFGEMLSIPRTWHELDQQLAFFHRPETKQYGGLLFRTAGYLGWEWWVRFHAKGYWPLSPTLEPQINNAAGIQALEEMIQASQYLAPGAESLGLFANWERYSHGDIYCNIGWGGSQKYLNGPKSAIRGKMVYGPTPGGIVDNKLLLTPYFNWGWNYVVTTGSNVPELAYLFALFSSSSIMSTESVRQQGGYFDPFRPEHYQDTEIQRIYSQEFLSVHQDSLKNSIPDLYLANQGQYIQTLNNWLDRALSGAVTATEALNRVAEHWNIINDRSDIRLQQERWRNLRGKYPETVRNLLRDIV